MTDFPQDLQEDIAKYAPLYEGIKVLVTMFQEEKDIVVKSLIVDDLRELFNDIKK